MPKKFTGESSKVTAAKARKEQSLKIKQDKKKQEEEDALWQENDRNVLKKQRKKQEEKEKKQQQLLKKAEIRTLLEQETSGVKKPEVAERKTTRAEIECYKVRNIKPEEKKLVTHLDVPLIENVNKLGVMQEEARNVLAAIKILSDVEDDVNKNPEKRNKAAYTAFEDRRMGELKLSHPSLKRSQLKQMVFKEWAKAPENPINNSTCY